VQSSFSELIDEEEYDSEATPRQPEKKAPVL
jgi:hypothetical protein